MPLRQGFPGPSGSACRNFPYSASLNGITATELVHIVVRGYKHHLPKPAVSQTGKTRHLFPGTDSDAQHRLLIFWIIRCHALFLSEKKIRQKTHTQTPNRKTPDAGIKKLPVLRQNNRYGERINRHQSKNSFRHELY